jgi:hypothetical protein
VTRTNRLTQALDADEFARLDAMARSQIARQHERSEQANPKRTVVRRDECVRLVDDDVVHSSISSDAP